MATGTGLNLDRNGLEILERDECLRLLGSVRLGRVAITSGALPLVLPVRFGLVGEEIVFRTGEGTKLDAATRNAVVAFEADWFDADDGSGWSVVVTGMARELLDHSRLEALVHTPAPRLAPGCGARAVVIDTDIISGRRLLAS